MARIYFSLFVLFFIILLFIVDKTFSMWYIIYVIIFILRGESSRMENGIVLTCFVGDWLDFRSAYPNAMEVDTAKFKIYNGVFNLKWNELSENIAESWNILFQVA